jgi:hypothetical protein
VNCCVVPGGRLLKAPPKTLPPRPRTGHAHPSCYLSNTNDCSKNISGEHYLSRHVLEVLGPTIDLEGLPWLKEGEHKTVGIDSLTANILCVRHNSCLSPLDTEAGRFFGRLDEIDAILAKKSLSKKVHRYLFSGLGLDMWMAKVVCGFYYSGIAVEAGARLVATHSLDWEIVRDALLLGRFAPGAGMYMLAPRGSSVDIQRRIQLSQLTMVNEKRLIGFRINLRNHEFHFLMDTRGVALPSEQDGFFYRPSELVFNDNKRSHIVYLTWPEHVGRSISMTKLKMGRG